MRPSDHMRSLVAYSVWANDRIVGAARVLPEADLSSDLGGYDTILGTLNHYLWAQQMWLGRLRGRPNIDRLALKPPALWEEFIRGDTALADFAGLLGDGDFERMIDYHDTKGIAHHRTLGQLLTHVVNHGTYHRGEAGLMLTRLGRSPGDLDYVYFIPEGV
ncbi:MAG TPA: DinB family protein [Candidatus Dormibacteraeota bacterium]|nr:DinB family protein [Candidatus Dormibacteraeota bacterium]